MSSGTTQDEVKIIKGTLNVAELFSAIQTTATDLIGYSSRLAAIGSQLRSLVSDLTALDASPGDEVLQAETLAIIADLVASVGSEETPYIQSLLAAVGGDDITTAINETQAIISKIQIINNVIVQLIEILNDPAPLNNLQAALTSLTTFSNDLATAFGTTSTISTETQAVIADLQLLITKYGVVQGVDFSYQLTEEGYYNITFTGATTILSIALTPIRSSDHWYVEKPFPIIGDTVTIYPKTAITGTNVNFIAVISL